jgi:hypothetical protein
MNCVKCFRWPLHKAGSRIQPDTPCQNQDFRFAEIAHWMETIISPG